MRSFDMLLRGGLVVDGSGGPPRRADIAIRGSRIADVGEVEDAATAATELDVSGLMLFPGFVDTHVHADAQIFDAETQRAVLRQGVTTLILGQDGLSLAPSTRDTFSYASTYFSPVNGTHSALPAGGYSVAQLLARYDEATPLNVGYLAPHGTIRHAVLGVDDREPSARELSSMRRLLDDALAEGALGLSTGLDYLPGALAGTGEISKLCETVADADGIYVTHMRGYGDKAPKGMAEVVDIATGSECRTHVSHYHGPGELLAKLLDDALGSGVDLTFDSYPYLRGSSILAMAVLPAWVQAGGPQTACERLRDRRVRDRLHRDWFPSLAEHVLTGVTLSHVPAAEYAWAEGMSLPAAAAEADLPLEEFVCELFVAAEMAVGCILAQPPANTDDGVRTLLRHPAHMAGSDGIYVGGHPHPRGWGAFARFLGRHTRELGDYDWGGASVHLAGRAARRFQLGDRGELRPGLAADVVALDPRTVTDRSTYETPRRDAAGVHHVLVGGRLVLRDGDLTGATSGRSLRPTAPVEGAGGGR